MKREDVIKTSANIAVLLNPEIHENTQKPFAVVTDTHFSYLPFAAKPYGSIFGKVVQKGQPVAGVEINLILTEPSYRYYPTVLNTVMTATTNLEGRYEFVGAPNLNMQVGNYWIRYVNPKKAPQFGDDRLAVMQTNKLKKGQYVYGYTNDTTLEVVTMDIQDVVIGRPFDPNYKINFAVSNSALFTWTKRVDFGDGPFGQHIRIYSPTINSISAGYIYNISTSGDNLQLSGVIPDELIYDTLYHWDVMLRDEYPSGPYGISYHHGIITFKR